MPSETEVIQVVTQWMDKLDSEVAQRVLDYLEARYRVSDEVKEEDIDHRD